MIRPSTRAIWFSLAGALLTVLLVMVAPQWWMLSMVVVLAIFGVLLLDTALTPFASSFSIDFVLPPFLYIGKDEKAVLKLSPARGVPPERIDFVFDVNDVLEPLDDVSVPFAEKGETIFELPLRARRRGAGRIPCLWMRWQGPFGLMLKIRKVNVEEVVRVVPDIRTAQKAAIEFSSRDAFFGVKLDKWRGEGTEFESLREFQAGFDPGTIDWKQSARHRLLLSREFRTERNHQIVVAFDVGHLMAEPHQGVPKLDHAINAGLLIGLLAVLNEDQLGVFAFDSQVRHFIRPMPGQRAFTQLQMATADLDYSREESNFTLALSTLQTRLQRRSLIILFTDFVDSISADLMIDSLARLSKRHVILFTTLRDPYLRETMDMHPSEIGDIAKSVITAELQDERQVVLEKLTRMGIHTIETSRDEFGAAVLNKYLEIKSRELI